MRLYSMGAQTEESHSLFNKGSERRLSQGKRLSVALSPSLNNPMILIIHISTPLHSEPRAAGCYRLCFILYVLSVIFSCLLVL